MTRNNSRIKGISRLHLTINNFTLKKYLQGLAVVAAVVTSYVYIDPVTIRFPDKHKSVLM